MITVWECPYCSVTTEIEGEDLQEISRKRQILKLNGCEICEGGLKGKVLIELFTTGLMGV